MKVSKFSMHLSVLNVLSDEDESEQEQAVLDEREDAIDDSLE